MFFFLVSMVKWPCCNRNILFRVCVSVLVCVCVSYTVFHTPSRTYKVPCMCALLSTPQLSLHKKVILIRWIPGRLICGSLPECKQRISPGSARITYLESQKSHSWPWPEQCNNLLPSWVLWLCSITLGCSQLSRPCLFFLKRTFPALVPSLCKDTPTGPASPKCEM